MKKIKEYKGIIIIILIFAIGVFYWIQIRPVQIRKGCAKESLVYKDYNEIDNYKYGNCLKLKGLK